MSSSSCRVQGTQLTEGATCVCVWRVHVLTEGSMCVCVWRVRVHLQLDNVFNEALRASLSRVPDDLHEIRPRRSVLIGLQPQSRARVIKRNMTLFHLVSRSENDDAWAAAAARAWPLRTEARLIAACSLRWLRWRHRPARAR